jgi:glutamyl-tRNA reductase
MVLVLIGASHHDVDLELLSRLALAEDGLAERLAAEHPDVGGCVVLSTCNRFEVYLDLERFHSAVDHALELIAEASGADLATVTDAMGVVVGTSVAQHLFSVASGLESMVVGEDEIAGQVRKALADAQDAGTTTPTLERLLQQALGTSKAVTSSTGLGAAGRSIVGVGLDLIEQRHGPVAGRRALVVGTGAYARVVVAALQRMGCDDIHVYSGSGQASLFAETRAVRAVAEGELVAAIAEADLVVTSSGTVRHLIDESIVRAARVDDAPTLPIMDLALSPDVAPGVRLLGQVDLIDLATIGEHAPEEHASSLLEAQDIVLRAVEAFEEHETGRTADHAVVAMRAHVMAIINEELERIRGRVDDETAEEVARSLHRVSNAILHQPSVRARELAQAGDFSEYQRAIHTLFGIDVAADPDA